MRNNGSRSWANCQAIMPNQVAPTTKRVARLAQSHAKRWRSSSVPSHKYVGIREPMHPILPRCSSVEYRQGICALLAPCRLGASAPLGAATYFWDGTLCASRPSWSSRRLFSSSTSRWKKQKTRLPPLIAPQPRREAVQAFSVAHGETKRPPGHARDRKDLIGSRSIEGDFATLGSTAIDGFHYLEHVVAFRAR
jgi:hypothetical protein